MRIDLKRDLLVFVVVFGVLTLPFLFFDLDITLQNPILKKNIGLDHCFGQKET